MAAGGLRYDSEGNLREAFSCDSCACLSAAHRTRVCDAAVAKGSNYYFEVECEAGSEGGAKVCRNTKYGKSKKDTSSEKSAAPETDPGLRGPGPAAQEEGAGGQDTERQEEADEFYGEEAGELQAAAEL